MKFCRKLCGIKQDYGELWKIMEGYVDLEDYYDLVMEEFSNCRGL